MTTMKKEYIAPTIEVVEMEVVAMIAGSIQDGLEIGGDMTRPPVEELSNRRRNYWKEVGKR